MTNVTVYTLPLCTKCDQTKLLLDTLEIPYEEINLAEDDAERIRIRDFYGFSSAPVVVTDDDAWSGFDPKKIRGLL